MEVFKGIKHFFFPTNEVDEGSSAPKPVADGPHNVYEELQAERAATQGINANGCNIVNIQATAQLQVVLVKPEVYTDVQAIADHLIEKKTVVLNLETANPENRRRIIDFLVGVSYAIGGSLKPVAKLTYVITPYNVDFIGEDLAAELESSGVFLS